MPYLTPDSPTENVGLFLTVPNTLLPSIMGAISSLWQPYRWEQFGSMTIPEVMNAIGGVILSSVEGPLPMTELASASFTRAGGSYSTASLSFVDVDSQNFALTITTGAHRVMVTLMAAVSFAAAPNSVDFNLLVDGVPATSQARGIASRYLHTTDWDLISFTWITDALSAAAHTIKLQWKVTAAGTATMYGAGSAWPARFVVAELATS